MTNNHSRDRSHSHRTSTSNTDSNGNITNIRMRKIKEGVTIQCQQPRGLEAMMQIERVEAVQTRRGKQARFVARVF